MNVEDPITKFHDMQLPKLKCLMEEKEEVVVVVHITSLENGVMPVTKTYSGLTSSGNITLKRINEKILNHDDFNREGRKIYTFEINI